MGTFEKLTKYLLQLDGEEFGAWYIDRENDGTPDHPIQMPFVHYFVLVHPVIVDVYEYVDAHEDIE